MSQPSSASTFAILAGERRRSSPTQLWMLYEPTLIRCTPSTAARSVQSLGKLPILRRGRRLVSAGVREQPRAVGPQGRRGIRAESPGRRHLREPDEQERLEVLCKRALERGERHV